MKNSILSITLRLFIITAAAALCLAAVNMITSPIIEANTLKTQTEAKMEVLPKAKEFKKLNFAESDIPVGTENGVRIEEFSIGLDGKESVGYVVTSVSANGYGGDVKVMVGLDLDLKIENVKIIEASETPGLGGNASKPEFIGQFTGKSGGLEVVKGKSGGDGEISAISSATVTSRAVTSAVNAAVELLESKIEAGFTPTSVTDTSEKQKEIEEKTKEQIAEQTGGAAE